MFHAPVFLDIHYLLEEVLAIPAHVPVRATVMPERTESPFAPTLTVAGTLKESTLSARMAKVVNDRANNLCPGLELNLSEELSKELSEERPEELSEPEEPPDPFCIEEDGQEDGWGGYGGLFSSEHVSADECPHWADQLILIKFRHGCKKLDPFDYSETQLKTDVDLRTKARDQITYRAEFTLNIQHRTFLIMLLIMGRRVRVLRWDASGVATTPAIDYVLRWKWFSEVLWRISVLAKYAPECLGMDTTASRIRPGDPRWAIMDDAGRVRDTDVDETERELHDGEIPGAFTWKYIRTLFRTSLADDWPRFELTVPDENEADGLHRFLVCRPHFNAEGETGRGTRGYVALDTRTGELTWLKDVWRANYKDAKKEGDVLAKLNAKGVYHVPTLVCHGDINGHTTRTSELWDIWQNRTFGAKRKHEGDPDDKGSDGRRRNEDTSAEDGDEEEREDDQDDHAYDHDASSRGPHGLYRHYRLVVKEVCLPLGQFTEPSQLVSIVLDCMSAHHAAWFLFQILHGDVSGGNILIYPRVILEDGIREIVWEGVLVDWEMAKDMREGKWRQPGRTGTWQFMSVELLTNQDKHVELPDDLESFFLVLLYYAIRYLDSNVKNVGNYIKGFFDAIRRQDDICTAGYAKRMTMEEGRQLTAVAGFGEEKLVFNLPLDSLLGKLLHLFQTAYKVREYDRSHAMRPLSSGVVENTSPQTPVKTTKSRARRRTAQFLKKTKKFNPERFAEAPPAVPTQHERDLAAEMVTSHETMAALLEESLRTPWPLGKVRDRILPDANSAQKRGPTATPSKAPDVRPQPSQLGASPVLTKETLVEARPDQRRKRRKVSKDNTDEAQGFEAGATKRKRKTARGRREPRDGTRKRTRPLNKGQ